jgi:hypothetical protein
MNDKLILFIDNYSFEKTANFDNNFNKVSSILEQPENEPKLKESFYHNSKTYNCDINGFGLKVQFNPNKLNNIKFSSEPLTYSKFMKSIENIESQLCDVGINAKLSNAKISRFDNSFDVTTKLDYVNYEPLILTLAPTTKTLRKGTKRICENTIYFGNKSNEITIYDKSKELGISENIIRFEYRHLRSKSLKLTMNLVDEKKYFELRNCDKEKIMKTVFSKNPKILESELSQYYCELIESDLTQQQIAKLLLAKFMQDLNKNNEIEKLLQVQRTNDKTYQRNYRLKNLLYDKINFKKDLQQRYDELKELFEVVA